MRIIDRYILLSVIRMFLAAILVFTFLYILIDVATHLDDFLSNKVPTATIVSYYLSFFPVMFVQTSPIACLLSVLFTYSGLNNNNEIIALRASGFNFTRITRPAIFFGLMATALVFLVNERFAPQAAMLAQEIKKTRIEINVKDRGNKLPPIKYLFFYGVDNRLFFIDEFDPSEKTLAGITVIGQDEKQRMTEKITAFKGVWTGRGWKLLNCQLSRYNPQDLTLTTDVQFFKEKTFEFNESPDDLLKQRMSVSSMNIRQLKNYIRRFKASGAIGAINNLRVDLHQRIAYPFACIVIIFVGLPFALITGRRKGLTFASVGIALAIGFLFYVVNAVGLALGKGGALPPAVAAWFAPVLFIAAGFYLVRKLF